MCGWKMFPHFNCHVAEEMVDEGTSYLTEPKVDQHQQQQHDLYAMYLTGTYPVPPTPPSSPKETPCIKYEKTYAFLSTERVCTKTDLFFHAPEGYIYGGSHPSSQGEGVSSSTASFKQGREDQKNIWSHDDDNSNSNNDRHHNKSKTLVSPLGFSFLPIFSKPKAESDEHVMEMEWIEENQVFALEKSKSRHVIPYSTESLLHQVQSCISQMYSYLCEVPPLYSESSLFNTLSKLALLQRSLSVCSDVAISKGNVAEECSNFMIGWHSTLFNSLVSSITSPEHVSHLRMNTDVFKTATEEEEEDTIKSNGNEQDGYSVNFNEEQEMTADMVEHFKEDKSGDIYVQKFLHMKKSNLVPLSCPHNALIGKFNNDVDTPTYEEEQSLLFESEKSDAFFLSFSDDETDGLSVFSELKEMNQVNSLRQTRLNEYLLFDYWISSSSPKEVEEKLAPLHEGSLLDYFPLSEPREDHTVPDIAESLGFEVILSDIDLSIS